MLFIDIVGYSKLLISEQSKSASDAMRFGNQQSAEESSRIAGVSAKKMKIIVD